MIELKSTQLELAIGHFFELVVKVGKELCFGRCNASTNKATGLKKIEIVEVDKSPVCFSSTIDKQLF